MKQAASFQKLRVPLAAAGHHRQHQPDRLLSDPVGPARTLQGRELGAVRRRHVAESLIRGLAATRKKAAGMPAAFSASALLLRAIDRLAPQRLPAFGRVDAAVLVESQRAKLRSPGP
jgi:hypothetical protein